MTTRSADKATELLEKRFRKAPESRLFSRLADAHRKEGNISRAIELCLDGIQKHPDYVTGHIILGRCYFEQQNYEGAFDEFKKACTIDRHNQIALKMLADILVQQNMDKKAGSLYEILFKMDPYNKSIAKLASQFPADGISGLYEILGIQPVAEPVSWESTSAGQQSLEQTVVYDEEPQLENFEDDSAAFQQPFDENQQFLPDTPIDNEKTVAIDGDEISQHLSSFFEENTDSQDSSFDSLMQEDSTDEQIQDLPPVINSEVVLDENADITGQDISSRIDELFSEKTDIFNHSTFQSMPEIITEDDSEASQELVEENTIALDQSANSSAPLEQSTHDPDLQLIQQPDLVIEQPQPFEDIDSFNGKNVLSEFEETMQFERSFLDNVIDVNESAEQTECPEKIEPCINENIIKEPDVQEISMNSSTGDAFDPSQIIIETDENINDLEKKPDDFQDTPSLIQTAEEQSADPFLSESQALDQSQIPENNLIIDSDLPFTEFSQQPEQSPEQLSDSEKVELDVNSDSNMALPAIELISNGVSEYPSINPNFDSGISDISKTNSGLITDDEDNGPTNQEPFTANELLDLSDQFDNISDNSSEVKNNDSLFEDSQTDILNQNFPEDSSGLSDEYSRLTVEPGLSEDFNRSTSITPVQAEILPGEMSDIDSSDVLQNEESGPEMLVLEDELNSVPDEFLSLANKSENCILIDSSDDPVTSPVEELEGDMPGKNSSLLLSNTEEQIMTDQEEQSVPKKESFTSYEEELNELNELSIAQEDLAIIDADSEIDQLSVEHGDDVLTDMDVLVSDEELNSVSGEDIVEKMDMLFPDEKSTAEVKVAENPVIIEEPVQSGDFPAHSSALSIEDGPGNQNGKFSVTDDPQSYSPQQLTVSDDGISINKISDDSAPSFASEIDENTQDISSIISGQDVMDRLDQFFPGNDLINKDSELIPADNNEEEEVLTDFYTVYGDNAVNAQSIEGLEEYDQEAELNNSEKSDKPLSFYDEWNDVCSVEDQNENDTFKENLQKNLDKSINEEISLQQVEKGEQDDSSRPYTIPDHVLTPTLADIYFQQGQHDLAVQIYKRLLSRDPDNENLQQKLNQLLEAAACGISNTVLQEDQNTKKAASANSPVKKRKTVVDNRPLAGVRIKKRKNSSGNRSKSNL